MCKGVKSSVPHNSSATQAVPKAKDNRKEDFKDAIGSAKNDVDDFAWDTGNAYVGQRVWRSGDDGDWAVEAAIVGHASKDKTGSEELWHIR